MAIRTEDHSDQSKFKNRLWKIFEKRGYKSPREVATILYDNDLVFVNSRNNSITGPDETRRNAIASVEKKIVRHLHSDTAKDLQGEYLIAYCNHFGCSADYLLGFIDIVSNDIETRKICEKTGLSENAVEKLISYTETNKHGFLRECWSILLESELFEKLPYDFSNLYEQYSDTLYFTACISATQKALSLTSSESLGYNNEVNKISVYEKGVREHYSAYYGLMHKIAQDVAAQMENLAKIYSEEHDVYDSEYEQALYDAQKRIAAFNNETPPTKPDSLQNKKNFEFNKHYIL